MFVPWSPRYSRDEAEEAIARSRSWADALRFLGLVPRGKNFTTIRKWATRWEIDVSHLPAYTPRHPAPSFSEQELRTAVARSRSWAETLRNLNACPTGGNPRTVKKWAERWRIDAGHFDPRAAAIEGLRRHRHAAKPLEDVLVEASTYSRNALKRRLYSTGLKHPVCEMCGQGEQWNGMTISMILDHTNGVRDDNRIANLRIVCPNCAAGLDTHCGRRRKALETVRDCLRCGSSFRPKYRDHRYCSRACGQRAPRSSAPRPALRKVERPPLDQLLDEVKRFGFCAVGRKYGVSDNAIRKWIRAYEGTDSGDRGHTDGSERFDGSHPSP